MKIRYGNILDVGRGVICHGCNTLGVMGAGLAAQIKDKYHDNVYIPYSKRCIDSGHHLIGTNFVTLATSELLIVNMFTQNRVGDPYRSTSYDAVDTCFRDLAKMCRNSIYEQNDVHIPLIGSGLGGGQWSIISEIIKHHTPYVNVWVYKENNND